MGRRAQRGELGHGCAGRHRRRTDGIPRSKARRADRLLIALSGASLVPLALSGHTGQESEDIAASSMIVHVLAAGGGGGRPCGLSLIHISAPTRRTPISYAV